MVWSNELSNNLFGDSVLLGQFIDLSLILLDESVKSWNVHELSEIWIWLIEQTQPSFSLLEFVEGLLLHSSISSVGLLELYFWVKILGNGVNTNE